MFKHAAVIDDDPISILVCKTLLKKVNFAQEISRFENAETALTFFESNPDNIPEFIFLDVVMPEINGWQFLQIFKKSNSSNNCKVVMLTASLDESDILKAKNFPEVIEIISKPINKEFIESLIEKY